jgi:hypothetical protein
MTTKKILRLMMGAALAIFFLWLIMRQISVAEIKQAFVGARTIWIGTALAAFAIGYACRIKRWHIMLQTVNPRLSWRNCAGPLLAGFALNNILPLRAGDILRSFAFNQKLGTTSGVMIATLFVERLLDLLMVLILLGGMLIFFDTSGVLLAGIGSTTFLLGGLIILTVLLAPHLFRPVLITLGRLLERAAPAAAGGRLLEEIDKILDILNQFAQKGAMLKLATWSLTAWLAEGCVYWFSALALPTVTVPLAGWLALPVSTLATLIPSTPGYVGTFDFFAIQAMTELGNSMPAAAAYALLIHILLWLPLTLAGGLYLIIHHVQAPCKHSPDNKKIP